jgi:hypothetical protein
MIIRKRKRETLEEYQPIKMDKLKKIMKSNDGQENAEENRDALLPAVKLLYYIHKKREITDNNGK